MPDLSAKTTDELLDRLAEIERTLPEPVAGQLIEKTYRAAVAALVEVAHIAAEIARRTATGWRPL